MFLTTEQYNETLELMSGNIKPSMLLQDLKAWVQEKYQLEVYNYLCDYTTNGLLRLRLVLWDRWAEDKMHDGPNYDKRKQREVAEKFAELARLYGVHQDYRNADTIFVCYETIRDEIQKDIMKRVSNRIMSIRHPDIWKIDICFGSVHIFYQTDEQIERNKKNGVSEEIKSRCTEIVREYDAFNVFWDGANCVFSSHQTIDEKYAGSMFYYYR